MIIDDLAANRTIIQPSNGTIKSLRSSDIEALAEGAIYASRAPVPVFKIDNVHDYYLETVVHGGDFFSQYPIAVALPSDTFWMEYVDVRERPALNAGIMVASRKLEGGGWRVGFTVYQQWSDEKSFTGMAIPISFELDGIGLIVPDSFRIPLSSEVELEDEEIDVSIHAAQTAWLALSFLNCKNVVVTDNEGKHVSRQERRASERRGDPALVTYKTLQIEPMKTVLATEGNIANNGLARALHICRGHFAEYGEEYGKGKLFGKFEGRYYVPAHVRGNAELGVVNKRYNVKAPDEKQS